MAEDAQGKSQQVENIEEAKKNKEQGGETNEPKARPWRAGIHVIEEMKKMHTLQTEQNWVQTLLEVEKTPNKPNQRPNLQLLEQGDLFCQSNNAVRLFRKSKMFLT